MKPLDEDQISEALSTVGRKGGIARAKKLTPERRKEMATKASKAAAKVRSLRRRRGAGRADLCSMKWGPQAARSLVFWTTSWRRPHCGKTLPRWEGLPVANITNYSL